MLFISSIMLVMQTEIRSGLKDIAKRESLMENLRRKQLVKKHLEEGGTLEELNQMVNKEDSKEITDQKDLGTFFEKESDAPDYESLQETDNTENEENDSIDDEQLAEIDT